MRAPFFSLCDELSAAFCLVVLVAADGGRGDAVAVEQLAGMAGVLAGDAIGGSAGRAARAG